MHTGRSTRWRRQPNFYGNAWPSYLMNRRHANAKIRNQVKRMQSAKRLKQNFVKKSTFTGLKSLRDYVPEADTSSSDEDSGKNSIIYQTINQLVMCKQK